MACLHLMSSSLSPPQLDAGARLHWRKCAKLPVRLSHAQVVVAGEKVYVGGGYTYFSSDGHRLFAYHRAEDRWSELPRSLVRWFGMAQFENRLITVGGCESISSKTLMTAKVLTLSADSLLWEEIIPPMPTRRHNLSVITTATAIIAAGGCVPEDKVCASVEVYSAESHRWYSAESLPEPQYNKPFVAVGDTCYFVGGNNCFWASLSSLVQRAISPTPPSSETLWKLLPPPPLNDCSLVGLSGSLVAVGGGQANSLLSGFRKTLLGRESSAALYVLLNDTWVRLVKADLPSACMFCATVRLAEDEVMVVGGYGWGLTGQLRDVYIGTLQT